MTNRRAARTALLLACALAGCHRVSVQPAPAPPAAPAPATASAMAAMPRDSARRGYTADDVRFMHHMLMHHAQALAMTAMAPSRSTRDDVKLVAERIAVSQRDETGLMERWLRARREPVPGAMEHMHHGAGATMPDSAHASMMASMPGMLTAAELAQLEASTGAAFDSLFVRFMIRHHEGALTMVKEYLATPGAAQESEIFRFASDIDADQRAEIRRLQSLLSK